MWILYSLLSSFLLAVINWLDEYLTSRSPFEGEGAVKSKVGSLLLISTLFSVVGISWLYFGLSNLNVSSLVLSLSLLSALAMVVMFGSYFYLINVYPVYQVIPLFQLTALWVLLFEIVGGGGVSLVGLVGVLLLCIGAYLLDVGVVKWSIPSSLLMLMVVVTFIYGIGVHAVRLASDLADPWVVSFWQYVGILGIGVLLFLLVPVFRNAFLFRLKKQGKVFAGISSISESMAQVSYVASNYAIALAPISAYAVAMGSIQSIFVLAIFYIFPQRKVTVNLVQTFAIIIIVLGAILVEVGS